MTQDKILILDFGSQVTQLIARRVREAHVYCELHSFDMPLEEIKTFNPKGIILSGGPNSVYESDYQADTGISIWAFRFWASATACNLWRTTWAAKLARATNANSVMRK